MRWGVVLGVLLVSSVAFAHPLSNQLDELDQALAPSQAFSPRALLALELPRLLVGLDASPSSKRTILDNPFMRAIFKGVRVPTLSEVAPEDRIMMLAVRPRGTGGLLRFRVRFDSGLFVNRPLGVIRRLLDARRASRYSAASGVDVGS